ncbi:metallophosphoesterase [Peribacillus glennii]|uniref:DUF4073 domain-containing protein n=1 Tax=Peribacillus glennii TaxID=2303991 RepID=A0A372L638_9BACI|nr:metallophosphoesterase [Peribacillus glennii]RFU60426.1 DUF4073 domain-containing protein [Peribacillus glennii]
MKEKQAHNIEESVNMEKKGMDRRSFLQGSTKIAGLAVGLSFANPLGGLDVEAASTKLAEKFGLSNGNPDLVFPVISDVHIHKNGTNDLQKFGNALHQLNELVPKQDAFVVVGDLTENGLAEEYDRFMTLIKEKKQQKAISLFAIGNHDYWNGLSIPDAQKRFLQKTGMDSIYYHKIIKGYHFIILGTENGLTEGYYSKQQIAWLDEKLKQANDDHPKKPIFVFHHQPMKNTMYGSEWGFQENRDLLYNTFKKYPQVISFSGHTHYPLDEPRAIHQKDFTSVETASLKDMWVEAGYIQGEMPPGSETFSQGLIVEVHGEKVVIHRRDFREKNPVGQPWIIDRPSEKRTFKYTETRDQRKPQFPKGSNLMVLHSTDTEIDILVPQAENNLLVHSYKIMAKNKSGKVAKEIDAFSEFYNNPVPDQLVFSIKGLQPGTNYTIEVFAVDSFGNRSMNPLKTEGQTKMKLL